jgi:hypothetical protein
MAMLSVKFPQLKKKKKKKETPQWAPKNCQVPPTKKKKNSGMGLQKNCIFKELKP